MTTPLTQFDPAIAQAIANETQRQHTHLELIASENFPSEAVLEAMSSVLNNKYAEGYPGRRYYGGCEYADVVENLAITRAQELFKAEHANVQPHCGSQANMAAFMACMNPGDTFLGMDLSQGGHLTHGHALSFSGRLFGAFAYGVSRDDERIDYDQLEVLAKQHRPKLIVCGASAYSRLIDFARIRAIAQGVDARVLADIAHIAGPVVAGLHPSPIPHADFVTTTTHKTLRGPRGGLILTSNAGAKDIDRAVFPGVQGGPLMHVIAAKAVAFKEALAPGFVDYQRRTLANARRLALALEGEGLRIVSGGTDNHLLLVDLTPLGVTGKVAELALGRAAITVNKNTIPFDPRPPAVTSGIRLGTPALTTRGMGEAEMDLTARLIVRVLRRPEDAAEAAAVAAEVGKLCERFPLYLSRRRSLGLA